MKICKFLVNFIIYVFVNIMSLFFYDRKYLRGKYFQSKCFGIFAPGWKWALIDVRARIFLGVNMNIPFPISPLIRVLGYSNIVFDVDDIDNFQGYGNYFQAFGTGKIIIGKGSFIAPNVGIITTNHDIYNPDLHTESKDVIIGEKCWIGMNSVILPGVVLGDHTTVGAGSVVTKSFKEGNCLIAGNPARKIKDLDYF